MILDIYKDSLEYSFKDEIAILKLGIMSILTFLIIPMFLFEGYNYRIIKTATNGMINGDDKVPDFDDLISMFVDGVKVFFVKLAYLIIPIIVFILTIIIGNYFEIINETLSEFIIIIGFILTIVIIVLSVLFARLAICRMAYNNDSMNSAFEIKEIFNTLKTIGILRYLGFNIGIAIIAFIIIAVIGGIFLFVCGLIGIVGTYLSSWNGALSGLFSSIGGIGMIIFLSFSILSIIFSLILTPFLSIFDNRAIGLIYEERDEIV